MSRLDELCANHILAVGAGPSEALARAPQVMRCGDLRLRLDLRE
jgi:hypothetical protein